MTPGPRGWVLGVFAPTAVSSLGAIVVLRSGFALSEGGLLGALAVLGVAQALILATAVSASALVTNLRVGEGGAYILVSRTYGLEVGGALALPVFLAQALGATAAAFGVAEVVRGLWAGAPVAALAGATVLAGGAAAWRVRISPRGWFAGSAALVAAGIASVLAGTSWGEARVEALGAWQGAGFWDLFALSFASSGLLVGLASARSVDEPEVALPRGLLAGVATSAVVQVLVLVGLANAADAAALADPLVWVRLGALPPAVLAGLFAACLVSGAVGLRSAVGTTRALAADRLLPAGFGDPDRSWGRALAGAVAAGAVVLGSLDAVASALAVVMLTAFGALNLVAGLEVLVGAPSWRPTVKVHGGVALAAGLACLAATFAIDPWLSAGLMAAEGVVFWTLSRWSLQAAFGDARHGLLLAAARLAAFRMRRVRPDARAWRPHIVVFTLDVRRSLPVVRWADAFGQHRGLVTVVHFVRAERASDDVHPARRTDEATLAAAGVRTILEVVAVRDLEEAALAVAQSAGLAGLHHNTTMVGWSSEEGVEQLARLLAFARRLAEVDRCTLIHVAPTPGNDRPAPPGGAARVVVWWTGRENHGDLMLLLAHLATTGRQHRGTRIQLKTVVDDSDAAREMQRDFDGMLPGLRMDLDVDVIVRGRLTVREVIARDSAGATLVFLGLALPAPGEEAARAERLDGLLRELPATLLVHNAGPFRGRLV